MKQYIMGMITGVSLILCAVMFMGNAKYDIYHKLSSVEDDIESVLEEITGGVYCYSGSVDCN